MLTTQTTVRTSTTSRSMASKTRTRGTSYRILGLSPTVNEQFNRAIMLRGEKSKSAFIASMVRRTIIEAKAEFGDLLAVQSLDEKEIIACIADGHAEPETIASETLIPLGKVKQLLAGLVRRGYLRTERKGGKTEGARGAVITLYFLPRER